MSPSAIPLPLNVWWGYGCAVVLGACLASFANVLIYRLPRDLSIVGPRSYCPACRTPIRWYDNIPIAGWLFLKGRCRSCGAGIDGRYVLVEVAGAICGAVAYWRFGPSAAGLAALLFLVDLLAIAIIDWEHMIIPHTLTISGMICGLGLAPGTGLGLSAAFWGGMVGAGSVLALSYGYRLCRGQYGMGGGDVMLMGMVGTFLGVWGVVLVLFGGAVLGSLYVLARHSATLSGQSKLPFGTFLAAAASLVLVVGEPIVQWYLGLLS